MFLTFPHKEIVTRKQIALTCDRKHILFLFQAKPAQHHLKTLLKNSVLLLIH